MDNQSRKKIGRVPIDGMDGTKDRTTLSTKIGRKINGGGLKQRGSIEENV